MTEYYERSNKLGRLQMSSFFVRCLVVLLAMSTSVVWAGSSFSGFFSNAPSTATLAPGQVFTVTLTAGSSSVPPTLLLNTLTLTDPSGQFQIVGGTCAAGNNYSNAQTCTVLVRFNGNAAGTFNGTLTGSCSLIAAVGGYSITCGTTAGVVGPVGTFAQFTGNGIAVAINTAVDTLGPGGLALLICAVLAVGAFQTLRARV
jgi:hypothetical protein